MQGNVQVIYMDAESKISLCQPVKGKGCCACCGLFNCSDISFTGLSHFLLNTTLEMHKQPINLGNPVRDFASLRQRYVFRDHTTFVCPYMGFIDKNTPGCLMHPSVNKGIDGRDYSLYGKEICNDFFCPAYRILDARLQRILIAYTDNWYTYSIGIIDPLSFIWIVKLIEDMAGTAISPENNPADTTLATLINTSLMMLALFFNQLQVPVFFYSEPEYHLHMRLLSLNQNSTHNAKVRVAITQAIDAILNGC